MPLLALLLLAAGATDHASLERDVRALIGIRTSNAPSLSPDGKRVAYLSNITGWPQVWTVSTQGGLAGAGDELRRPGHGGGVVAGR